MEFLTTKEAAQKLKCSRTKIYQMIDNGEIQAVYLDNSFKILTKELDNYCLKNKEPLNLDFNKHSYGNKRLNIEKFIEKRKQKKKFKT